MKRYVKIYREPSIITFPTRQEAEGIDYYSIINPKFDVVRILSAEEEKEFAWEWFKKCFGKIEKKEEEELLREEFECLWKEQS